MSDDDVVAAIPDLQRIRRNQDLAWELIVGSEAERAMTLLEEIHQEVEECEGTFEWARQPFLLAKAYAAVNHRVAEVLFTDALNRISKLPTADVQYSFLVHKSYGRYLFGKNKFSAAKRQYELAEHFGIALGPSEDLYQTYLRIIETNYRINKDQIQQRNFESFKRRADAKHCTFEHQHRAWMKHEKSLQKAAGEALFMRNVNSLDAAYFDNLLDSTTDNESETEKGENK